MIAKMAELWIRAGGSVDGLAELITIARRNCSHGLSYATAATAAKSCDCAVHTYLRSEPGLYRLAYVERNRDAYVSNEWNLWCKEDDDCVPA